MLLRAELLKLRVLLKVTVVRETDCCSVKLFMSQYFQKCNTTESSHLFLSVNTGHCVNLSICVSQTFSVDPDTITVPIWFIARL